MCYTGWALDSRNFTWRIVVFGKRHFSARQLTQLFEKRLAPLGLTTLSLFVFLCFLLSPSTVTFLLSRRYATTTKSASYGCNNCYQSIYLWLLSRSSSTTTKYYDYFSSFLKQITSKKSDTAAAVAEPPVLRQMIYRQYNFTLLCLARQSLLRQYTKKLSYKISNLL